MFKRKIINKRLIESQNVKLYNKYKNKASDFF